MKHLNKYIFGALALLAASALPACQDHFDEPGKGENVPVASMTPNATIAEVKELLWSDEYNYCEPVYTKEWYATPEDQRTEELKTQGEHIVIAGRVVSSDYAGNCFKYIVLQDETGALNFSINSYNLYLNYRVGQEIVVDLTGLHMGKYRGLEQVGFPSFNSSIPGYETSFMAPEMFARNIELNGLPDADKVETIEVNNFAELGVTPADLRKWQSQRVRLNNVEFVPNTTTPTLSTYHSSGVTQQIRDAQGNTLDVRTSGYANFWNMELPEGRCDVVALLGYYVNLAGNGGWQLTLIDANSIMNVGDPTVPKGSEGNPFSVLEAIAFEVNGPATTGWLRGYIVGTVAPEVETVASNNDVEWSANPTLGNTIVIGQTPETTDISECVVVALPQGSELQKLGALRENPSNYGKMIDIRGSFATVMGTYGLADNNGAAGSFKIEGVNDTPVEPSTGDGSEENPYTCAQVIAMNPSSTSDAVQSGVWTAGYIVGYYQDYAPHFEAGGSQRANILLSDNPAADNVSNCICIQLVAQTDARNALNLVDNPGKLGTKVQVFGDVMKYNTLPGIKNTSNYKADGSGDTPVTPGTPEGDGTAANPYNATAALNVAKALAEGQEVEAYAKGKVAAISDVSTDFGNATYTITDGSTNFSVYRGYYLNGDKFTSADQLKVGDEVVVFGKLVNYKGNTPQFTTGSKLISINGQGSSGGDTPVTPPTPSETFKGDFNTFNGGTPKSTYGTYTNATGWTATNAAILSGLNAGETEQNPRFAFIGDGSTLAPTLNGNTDKPGKLVSPKLTGGCGTLTFKYGFAFGDSKCSFTVNVLQNGAVVKTQTVTVDPLEKKHAYDFSLDVNISGDFTIEIVNDCLSGSATNKDRVSIWNLTWN